MAEIDVTRRTAAAGTTTHAAHLDPVVERTGFRLSWGGIFAGFVVATALQMVLTTLGAAIGMAAFDPGQGDSAASLGIGAALWFAVTALISMFIGGMTCGKLAGILTRGDGMMHGVIMWGLSLLLAIYLGSTGAGKVLGGVTGFLGQTASSAVGGAVSGAGAVGASAAENGGIDVPQGAQQDAQAAAQSAQQQIQQQAPQVQARAEQVAGDAANTGAKAAWGALLVMGLSVAAAAFGAGSTARK
jgi:hypothetical protein